MRYRIIPSSMLLCAALSAGAQVSIGIAVSGVSIGINVPVYPTLVRVPDTPVYYAPQQVTPARRRVGAPAAKVGR